MPAHDILADVPVAYTPTGFEPMPGEMICAGCPAGGKEQSLTDLDIEGSGPDKVIVGPNILFVCCKIEKMVGHMADMTDQIIFERGSKNG